MLYSLNSIKLDGPIAKFHILMHQTQNHILEHQQVRFHKEILLLKMQVLLFCQVFYWSKQITFSQESL